MVRNSFFVIEGPRDIASLGRLPKEAIASDSVPQDADYRAFSRFLEGGMNVEYFVDIDGEFK
jgi:hypothetical protein